ncbi:PREDICTED: uncharacterized protein LOC100633513 [Amphimedon queenslandica]|uniref:Secreted protein n=1 Tax=Amphimedon queenslandica TaxID=400682 RepID=A0A1X7UTR0_AMPQE|nr:PREDICTED: uncharacterized protein LOC100633513 [Amphimedon queenslandica]|eukprot:XP_003386863.1 PREDICTED: uncharacterized protein LOC100633513 [Amphimedon queenslandica]
MSRFLFLALLVVGFVALSDARVLRRPTFQKSQHIAARTISEAIRKFKVELATHQSKREKRQSANCFIDAQQTTVDPFKSCLATFEAYPNVTSSDVAGFCRNHCPHVILTLFHKLTVDCGSNFVGPVNQTALDYLNQSCYHDPRGRYCINDWNELDSLIPEDDTADFDTCISAYHQGQCSSACKTATKDITSILGCCYYELDASNPGQLIPPSAFTDCGYRKPVKCIR